MFEEIRSCLEIFVATLRELYSAIQPAFCVLKPFRHAAAPIVRIVTWQNRFEDADTDSFMLISLSSLHQALKLSTGEGRWGGSLLGGLRGSNVRLGDRAQATAGQQGHCDSKLGIQS